MRCYFNHVYLRFRGMIFHCGRSGIGSCSVMQPWDIGSSASGRAGLRLPASSVPSYAGNTSGMRGATPSTTPYKRREEVIREEKSRGFKRRRSHHRRERGVGPSTTCNSRGDFRADIRSEVYKNAPTCGMERFYGNGTILQKKYSNMYLVRHAGIAQETLRQELVHILIRRFSRHDGQGGKERGHRRGRR